MEGEDTPGIISQFLNWILDPQNLENKQNQLGWALSGSKLPCGHLRLSCTDCAIDVFARQLHISNAVAAVRHYEGAISTALQGKILKQQPKKKHIELLLVMRQAKIPDVKDHLQSDLAVEPIHYGFVTKGKIHYKNASLISFDLIRAAQWLIKLECFGVTSSFSVLKCYHYHRSVELPMWRKNIFTG